MALYRVWARLEGEDYIEADSEDAAFEQFSDDLMSGGCWDYRVELEEESDEVD